MLPIEEYMLLREPPSGPHVMYQRWRWLLFVHYAADPAQIQTLLPDELTVDTYGGEAYVGFVPFRMEGVRGRYLPGFPGHASFAETNLRTYVHREGSHPGVWFFSLDAASAVACRFARAAWRLPYHEAQMSVEKIDDFVDYQSVRRHGNAMSNLSFAIGDELPAPMPGSLEFFLVERYLLYAKKSGCLYEGRVHHDPYSVRSGTLRSYLETISAASNLESGPIISTLYSEGVDVRVWPIRRV